MWFFNINYTNVNYTRGLAPFTHSLRGRGEGKGRRRGGSDLVEAGDNGGLEAVSMGSPAWREDDLLRPA